MGLQKWTKTCRPIAPRQFLKKWAECKKYDGRPSAELHLCTLAIMDKKKLSNCSWNIQTQEFSWIQEIKMDGQHLCMLVISSETEETLLKAFLAL